MILRSELSSETIHEGLSLGMIMSKDVRLLSERQGTHYAEPAGCKNFKIFLEIRC